MAYIQRIILLTALAILPFIALFGFLLYRQIKKNSQSERVSKLVNEGLDYSKDFNSPKNSLEDKYVDFWRQLLKPAGLVEVTSDDKQNAVKILMITAGLYLLTYFLTKNPIFGIVPMIAVNGGLILYCRSKIQAKEALLNEQVPSFLSSLKSNIQSNATPEFALIAAIENTVSPLREELEIVKNLIEAGTFETALAALRNKTKNQYIIFLCSCIELSNEVGANLEDQIGVIENMISERQELSRKTDTAVAEQMPILYVSIIVIPGLFIWMYVMQESVREFWFKSLLSWGLFLSIFAIAGFGFYMGNKAIQGVRKL